MRPGVIGGWRPVLQIEEDVVVRVLQGEYDAVGVWRVLVPLQRLVDALRDAKLDPQGSLDHVPGGTGPDAIARGCTGILATVHPLLRVLNHGGSLVARGGGEGVDGLDRVRAGLVDDVHVVLVKQVHLVHDGCRHVRRGDSVTHDGKRISVLDDAAASSIFDELFRDVADVAREPGVVLTHAHGVDELVDRGASHALGVHVPSRHGVVARDAAGLGGLAAECPSVDAQRGHGVAGPLGEARVVVVHDVELPRTAGSGASGSPDVKEHPRVLGAINWECSDSASQVEVVGEDKIEVVDAVVFPVGDV